MTHPAIPRVQPSHAPVMRRLRRDGHSIAFTLAGDDAGAPIVVLHGGPGSGSQTGILRGLAGAPLRIVFVDQRGAGASSPRGALRRNDTDRLVEDLEAIRRMLGIECWGVVGGSWGAALALAYAGRYPERVTGVVLRGLFLTSRREVRRLFVTSRTRAPREWRQLCAAAGGTRPGALLRGCARRLRHGVGLARQRAVALAWHAYEDTILASARTRAARFRKTVAPKAAQRLIDKYRIQAHYLLHDCWLGERRLLALARRAAEAGVPVFAAHGRRDPVCPIDNVDRLARAVPAARIARVDAGHLSSDPALARCVARAIRVMFADPARRRRDAQSHA